MMNDDDDNHEVVVAIVVVFGDCLGWCRRRHRSIFLLPGLFEFKGDGVLPESGSSGQSLLS